MQKESVAHNEEHCPTDATSLTTAHIQLKTFSQAWRASGCPPLSVLAFDVSKAFDNVDVEAVKQLLKQVVKSPGWRLHKVHSTVWARGAFVTRCVLLEYRRIVAIVFGYLKGQMSSIFLFTDVRSYSMAFSERVLAR